MSTAGGQWRALERGQSIGCQVVQLFLKSNMRWFGRRYEPAELERFARARAAHRFACVFGHVGYLVNLAAPASPNRDRSICSLIHEIELAGSLGLPFLVLHPGAHLGGGETAGLRQAAAGLNEALAATRHVPVRLALENTAGQGTCLGGRLTHLAALYEQVDRPERLGVCLDTAHLFAAGYDIRTPGGWDAVVGEIQALVGLPEIRAFHLNDSKADLGAHVDRHEHIGRGRLGLRAFRHIVNDARFGDRPGCLETPKSDGLRADAANLARLRGLMRAAADQRRRERQW